MVINKTCKWPKVAVSLFIVFALNHCSKKEDPAPPPPPENPNPVTPTQTGAQCAPLPAGGTPFRSDNAPYTANLFNTQNGNSANSISLQLQYMGFSGDAAVNSVVGTATLNLSDLTYAFRGGLPNASFCVSSVSQAGTNSMLPGTFDRRSGTLALLMTGMLNQVPAQQVPSYTPFPGSPTGTSPYYPTNPSAYPGGTTPQQTSMKVDVAIGAFRGCGAGLVQGRLAPGSCVIVTLGEGAYAKRLQYQADTGTGFPGNYNTGGYYGDPYASSGGYYGDPYASGGYYGDPYASGGYYGDPGYTNGYYGDPYVAGGYTSDPYATGGYYGDPYFNGGYNTHPYGSGLSEETLRDILKD